MCFSVEMGSSRKWSTENELAAHSSDCGPLVTNVAACFPSIRLVIGMLSILLLCAGCSVRRVVFNDVVTSEQVNFIRIGETTMLELADQIGAGHAHFAVETELFFAAR